MHSYAILGATGQTGSALLKQLSASPDNHINVYVFDFEGSLRDTTLMASCLEGVDAIFATVATNDSIPGCRIAQDAAQSLVAALVEIKHSQTTSSMDEARSPRILFLNSASLPPHLKEDVPAAAKWLVHTALSYVCDDLAHAQDYLRLHASWLDVVFIRPPGLVNDMQRGQAVSLNRVGGFLSYADLAAGMLKVAEADGPYSWNCVGITPTSPDAKIEWNAPLNLTRCKCGTSLLNSTGWGGGLGWFRSLILSSMQSVMSDVAYYISHGMLVHRSALYREYLAFLQEALALKNDSGQRHSMLLTSI